MLLLNCYQLLPVQPPGVGQAEKPTPLGNVEYTVDRRWLAVATWKRESVVMQLRSLRVFLWVLVISCLAGSNSLALTTQLNNLVLVPPSDGVNQSTLTVTTDVAGSDSDTVTLSGQISADLDFQFVDGQVVPTGLSFTGGSVGVSDANFSFLFGLVQVDTSGLAGTPFTDSPPGTVTDGEFLASEHTVLIDQGTVTAAGTTIDFAQEPSTFQGTGTGTLGVTTLPGPGPLPNYIVNATLELPLVIDQEFFVPNVPVVGDVTATLTGSTTAVATEQLILTLLVGDYDQDLALDCADAELLAAAVAAGSDDLTFDANFDGVVNADDVQAWATDLVGTLPGDANLDFVVDGADFIAWNANKFAGGTDWCSGDFNGDGVTDGGDFIVWNANKFTSTDVSAVPEPSSFWLWGLTIAALIFGRNHR